MATVNISLTDNQAKFVDSLVSTYGFANRSEFFRSMIRKLASDNGLASHVADYPFVREGDSIIDSKLMLLDRGKKDYVAGKLKKINSLEELL